ncbi:MAG: roadblock/LC7 domain-containing protein [Candidatus Heimdallarchaeota archaeon]
MAVADSLGNLQQIDKTLGNLLRSNRGIQFVLLSDKTGLSVSSVTRLLVRETTTMDLESIGAIAAAVFCGSEEQGTTLSLGGLGVMVAEFGDGKIMTASAGEGILVIMSDPDAKLGPIRHEMKRAAEGLQKALSQGYVKPAQKAPEEKESDKILSALEELDSF